MSAMPINLNLITHSKLAVTAMFEGFSLPFVNQHQLIIVIQAHGLVFAQFTPSAPSNICKITRLKLVRAEIPQAFRPILRIYDE